MQGTPVPNSGPFLSHPESVEVIPSSVLAKLREDAAEAGALQDNVAVLEEQVTELEAEVESLEESIDEYEQEAEADLDENTRLSHENELLKLEVEELKFRNTALAAATLNSLRTLEGYVEAAARLGSSELRAEMERVAGEAHDKLKGTYAACAIWMRLQKEKVENAKANHKREDEFFADMKAAREREREERG